MWGIAFILFAIAVRCWFFWRDRKWASGLKCCECNHPLGARYIEACTKKQTLIRRRTMNRRTRVVIWLDCDACGTQQEIRFHQAPQAVAPLDFPSTSLAQSEYADPNGAGS